MGKTTYEVVNEDGEREKRVSCTKKQKRKIDWSLILSIIAVILSGIAFLKNYNII